MANLIDITKARAVRLMDEANSCVSRGELDEALKLFKKSAELRPSAEAYTYWAWMLSFRGELAEAIELCKKAIALDQAFGNPYNDIGSYLIRLGKPEAAIEWLDKAKKAPRYEPRHFPFINLGRVYVAMGQLEQARQEFLGALEFSPENLEIQKVLTELEKQLN